MHRYKSFYTILLLCVCVIQLQAQVSNVYINEILASNTSRNLSPDFFSYEDWIEIANFNGTDVDLSGYFLSDDKSVPTKWAIPANTIIPANGVILFWADGRDTSVHTNFKLSRNGEFLGLYSPSAAAIDTITFGYQYDDISYGRLADTLSTWSFFNPPTPAAPNANNTIYGIVSDPVFSIPGGLYEGPQSVSITVSEPSAEIRYTTDGTIPTDSSILYTAPISINSTTAIRARAFEAGKLPSRILTNTYFINEQRHLPVISLVTDPDNFFDDQIGIYVTGTNGKPGDCDPTVRNLNQDWERPVNVEFYDTTGVMGFNQLAGVKIFGGCSRTRYPQKSLALFARSEYGKGSFEYKLFADKPITKFESFLLRSSADDQVSTMFRDALAQALLTEHMDADIQAYRPAAVFLNGIYWGIHNIREDINEHYIAGNFGIETENVNILERNASKIYGSDAARNSYIAMVNFINSNNMANQANYEAVKAQMDMNQYIDYMIGHIYLAERDWPSNNIKYWRANSGPYTKWRWINLDLDQTLTHKWIAENMVNKATAANGPSWPNPEWSTRLFRNLLNNVQFKNEFIQRYAWHMNVTFAPQRINHFVDRFAARIAPEIPRHIQKWGGMVDPDFNENGWEPIPTFSTVEQWQKNVDTIKIFAAERPAYSWTHMIQNFGLSGTSDILVQNNSLNQGVLSVAGKKVPDGFTGTFFNNVPLKISAMPKQGFKFSHWEAKGFSAESEIYLTTGAIWKYNDTGADLGTLWIQSAYNDASWSSGPSQLGYGDGDEATVTSFGPDAQNKYITTYFRKKFSVSNKSKITSISAEILVDDGAIIYLNGNEIHRVNMPAGTVTYTTPASSAIANENSFTAFTVNLADIVEGENIIAVEVHQSSGTSSDLSFDLKLSASMSSSSETQTFTTPEIAITLSEDLKLTAFYELDNTNTPLPIVINEINYSSAPNFNTDDWVEIYNYGNVLLNLSGWEFKDDGNNPDFKFPAGTTLGKNEYLVLCRDTNLFAEKFPHIKNRIGNFEFGLSSSGEKITLQDSDNNDIDEVTYSNAAPWPILASNAGNTIELTDHTLDNNLGTAWAVSTYNHGSPGIGNSAVVLNVREESHSLPTEFSLSQNYPNPFNPTTTINYSINEKGIVRLQVYNILGQLVRTLVNQTVSAGNYSIVWDGKNDSGTMVSSGVYIYILTSNIKRIAKRMVLLK